MTAFILKYTARFFSRNLCFVFTAVLFSFSGPLLTASRAQLVITSPVNHQVLQQDNKGLAKIAITGYAHYPYTRIEAFLIPDSDNPHTGIQHAFTEEQLRQGFFYTTLTAQTGWYQLKIVGYGEQGITDSATVDRVGIGEVFLVAGNSNAMGLPDLGAKDASDQVVSFDAVNKTLNAENITVAPDEPMPGPAYSILKSKNRIFPTGETSWYWGELGTMISRKMQTPVLFLNTAWAAANAENYRDGALGKDAFNFYLQKYWPNRQPYTNLVNTLRYFNAELGLRAVLWSHGENDAQLNYSEEAYFSSIKILIENSRKDAGLPASWVLARNSASFSIPKPFAPIINAQKRLVAIKDFKTFTGPDLDTIQLPRPAHGHFENVPGGTQGLTQAATAWNRVLTDSLFQTIVPLQPALAIHTGVVPSKVPPGARFTLPYIISGSANNQQTIQAELLDENGKYVSIAGRGNANLLNIQIPDGLANGRYHIRLTALNPVLTGSLSRLFLVDRSYRKVEFVSSITAKKTEDHTHIAWLVAANAEIKRMEIQKTTDGQTYSSLDTFDAVGNEKVSRLYSYQDKNAGDENSYYRIKMENASGGVSYSPLLAVFREGTPPDLVVFPNPVTNQQFYLRPDISATSFRCFLFDVRGREHPLFVSDNEVIGLLSIRPVHHLPAGNYILKVVTENGIKTQNILFN